VRFRAPGEQKAQERAWAVVRRAYEEREPVAWPRRHARPLAAAALVAAVAAAALSPPGRSVVHSLREAVGVEQAEPALFSLPTHGQLLVTSRKGTWLVHRDGSKRLLGRYRDATFSPHGLFIAATRANQLVALDPVGNVRWTLARPAPRHPVWTGTRTDTRITYVSAGQLRVVAGDGTGDHPVGPASQRSSPRQADRIRRRAGQSAVVDGGRVVFRGTGSFDQAVRSPDGRWLLVTWPTADQWVFVRSGTPRRIVGASRISVQFGGFPRVQGWCCAG
jgi:hypothetical protein